MREPVGGWRLAVGGESRSDDVSIPGLPPTVNRQPPTGCERLLFLPTHTHRSFSGGAAAECARAAGGAAAPLAGLGRQARARRAGVGGGGVGGRETGAARAGGGGDGDDP